jgi:hypothetical protein
VAWRPCALLTGLQRLLKDHPDVSVYVAAVDEGVNEVSEKRNTLPDYFIFPATICSEILKIRECPVARRL